eukprot:47440-Rhodomonas_salina.2
MQSSPSSLQGKEHLLPAGRTLQYLMGTHDQGITYWQLGASLSRRKVLEGWVASDYHDASHPDTHRSVTGYVMRVNGVPLSWEQSVRAA